MKEVEFAIANYSLGNGRRRFLFWPWPWFVLNGGVPKINFRLGKAFWEYFIIP